MPVVIINQNSTRPMTEAMMRAARVAAPGLSFQGWTSPDGPPWIQGAQDGAGATQGANGIIIGRFDDTALREAASIVACPVIGIGQAACHYAALRSWRFSVVTTLPVSVPVIEANIEALGLGGFLAGVRASDVPVLDLERDPRSSEALILVEVRRVGKEDDIDSIIRGCAGMASLFKAADQSVGLAVLDPVTVAATCMEWLL